MAQGPYFNWVRQMGAVDGTDKITIAQDPDENLIAAGLFEGSADFDHGDTELVFNAGGIKDVFISKTSPNGDFIWAKQIRSINNIDPFYLNGMITDMEGNIYITGSYVSPIDFDPDPSVEFIVDEVDPSNYDQDIYVAKYSPDGNLIWVKTVGYHDTDFGVTLNLASNGNVIVTGQYRYTVDFDPGEGVSTLNSSTSGIFLWTLTADGDYVDAKSISGTSNTMGVYKATMDANDNLYLVGGFYGTADFDPGAANYSLSSTGSGVTGFVCKLDSALSCVWAKPLHATSLSMALRDVKVDANDDVFLAGTFWGGVDLDPADDVSFDLVSAGNEDVFVLKLDANGAFVWGKHFGDTDSDQAMALEFGNDGNLLIGMNTRSATIDLDPGAGIQTFTNGGNYDLALLELTGNGDFISMKQISGSSLQQVNDIVLTPSSVYMGGTFAGSTDFDPGTGTTSLSPDESWDFFILKMGATPTHIDDRAQDLRMVLYPNPSNGLVNLSMVETTGKRTVEIYNYAGALLETIVADKTSCIIDLSQKPAGLYMIKVKDDSGSIVSQTVIRQ
jgi:hypothetical protein